MPVNVRVESWVSRTLPVPEIALASELLTVRLILKLPLSTIAPETEPEVVVLAEPNCNVPLLPMVIPPVPVPDPVVFVRISKPPLTVVPPV